MRVQRALISLVLAGALLANAGCMGRGLTATDMLAPEPAAEPATAGIVPLTVEQDQAIGGPDRN